MTEDTLYNLNVSYNEEDWLNNIRVRISRSSKFIDGVHDRVLLKLVKQTAKVMAYTISTSGVYLTKSFNVKSISMSNIDLIKDKEIILYMCVRDGKKSIIRYAEVK